MLVRRDGRGVRAPLRVALLDWLTSVLHHAAEPDERRRGFPADVDACRAARPAVHRAVSALRADADPSVAAAALGTLLACLLDAPASSTTGSGAHGCAARRSRTAFRQSSRSPVPTERCWT
ncbi:hypothetical protein ACFPIJ_44890 [Dactylosporangium cerinum]|uniref:Uncharacterized protein n=1 Tax=Dactylosporangium cerinum TaxID=1434730 RepID=A0ABV9W9D8_9ACTN